MPFTTTLQFTPGGPSVTGTWDTEEAAAYKWKEWFGLYGVPGSTTVITLVEQLPDGSERTIKQWSAAGEPGT